MEQLTPQTIEVMFNRVADQIEDMDKRHSNDLSYIKDQTTKTNGRVGVLEVDSIKNKVWQAKVDGAIKVIQVLGVPVVLFVLYQLIVKYFFN